jgi:hypothetical protein
LSSPCALPLSFPLVLLFLLHLSLTLLRHLFLLRVLQLPTCLSLLERHLGGAGVTTGGGDGSRGSAAGVGGSDESDAAVELDIRLLLRLRCGAGGSVRLLLADSQKQRVVIMLAVIPERFDMCMPV